MSTSTGTLTDAITDAIGPLDRWAHECHAASIRLVRSRALEQYAPHGLAHPGRVARGACRGVGGQHSWVVVGDDVYDPTALIIDVTRWSYTGEQPSVWVGNMTEDRLHIPHGSLSIWQWGRPEHGGGEDVPLSADDLSEDAARFVAMLGPLDAIGWATLWSSDAMRGWPAAEVLDAFLTQHYNLRGLVPIDVIGHLTNRNPQGLYLPA